MLHLRSLTCRSKFVLAMGDNFYSEGIPSDEHDSRFKTTFEDVYTYESLQTPWLVLAGMTSYIISINVSLPRKSRSCWQRER